MTIHLPEHLSIQIEQQIAAGQFRTAGKLVEEAVTLVLDHRAKAQRRHEALNRIGQMVDDAGLYERVLIPTEE